MNNFHSTSARNGFFSCGKIMIVALWAAIHFCQGIEPKNLEQLKKQAEQGDVKAQVELGICYVDGEGVSKNPAEGSKWFRKAAEQGYIIGQLFLGINYREGIGVVKNPFEAVKWFRKAADQGDANAQVQLGTCYDEGDGVSKDPIEAVKWYRKAADQGNAEAKGTLGCCYQLGIGIPKDLVEASKWHRKAAEQGHENSQYLLGRIYKNGDGVARDKVEAYKWVNLAAAQGAKDAKELLETLEASMTPEQIAFAQRLSSEFKPKSSEAAKIESAGRAVSDNPKGSGSGFFITQNGFAVTNAHVVKEGVKFRLVTAEGTIDARVVRVDEANDLALLKAQGDSFNPIPVVSSRLIRLGSTVATVGFPNPGMQGFAPKLAKGEIAAISGYQDDGRYFQISVPVQPGNSGGPLVDERCNVVGIVSAKLDAKIALDASGALPENVNYAVKGSYILSFLESIQEVSAGLKEPNTKDMKFEDVVATAQQSAVLVLVY